MKQLFFSALFMSLFFAAYAQTGAKPPAKKPGGTVTITELIVYNVVLYDTAKAEHVGSGWSGTGITDYNRAVEFKYLNLQQSRDFRNEFKKIIDTKGILFFDGEKEITKEKAMSRMVRQYYIDETDSLGNYTGQRVVNDTLELSKCSMITFYEEWSLNRSNGMIEKNVIGYMLNYYSEEKNFWIPLFGIVRDAKAIEKIRKMSE